ncbi:ribosome assembly cofactor RimP [Porphyromonadaceae bacterium OttesenSCG-928-L07]|nr:ribosome assembly cofactor RimP [Porphyromonadaceae bacterium OttesenSCG-928-L07]MDL2251972.1 ribosome assembly cofactor RimP [Odoribacter sp. OttesenSCG-928-J03]MDL2283433.1 ribosome assembly cofactor RimP [Odoribacter sp. OttesenSCG-928-G04]
MKKTQELLDTIELLLKDSDLFLVDLTVSKDNNIDVFIDSPQGVNISRCMELNRQLNEILDKDAEDYSLTVSSAGIGYPFKVPGQYYKNIGKQVEIILEGSSIKLQGTLKAFDGQSITFEYQEKVAVEGKKKKEIVTTEKNIPTDQIKQIKDIIVF